MVKLQNFGYFWVAKMLRRKKNASPPSPLVDQYLFLYIQTVNGNI